MKDSYLIAIQLYEDAVKAGAPPDLCQCCGAPVAEGLKGCFELFAALGARGYNDPAWTAPFFYGVDAHALQHPEVHGKKNNAAHLLRLHWIFAHDAHAQAGTVPRWWQRYLAHYAVPRLEPPAARGALTVVDVAAAAFPEEYTVLLRAWAESVYQAWSAHHDWARRELARVLQ
jgi:hypothetical protein